MQVNTELSAQLAWRTVVWRVLVAHQLEVSKAHGLAAQAAQATAQEQLAQRTRAEQQLEGVQSQVVKAARYCWLTESQQRIALEDQQQVLRAAELQSALQHAQVCYCVVLCRR